MDELATETAGSFGATSLAKALYNAGFNFSMWTSTDGYDSCEKYCVGLWNENQPYVYSNAMSSPERGLHGVCKVVE